MWSRDQRVIWHCGWVSLIISHYPIRFGGHGFCRSGDILFLFYYKSPSCQVGDSRRCSRENISVFLVTWHHVIKVVRKSRDIIGNFTSSYVTTLQSFVTWRKFENRRNNICLIPSFCRWCTFLKMFESPA